MVNFERLRPGSRKSKEALQAESRVDIDMVAGIYEHSSGGPGRLHRGETRDLFEGRPIAGLDTLSPGAESLDNIFIVGNTVLGLTRTRDERGRVTGRVRLAVLPIGDAAGRLLESDSSGTLVDIELAPLREVREDEHGRKRIMDWEPVVIGREEIQAVTGKYDSTVSAVHLGLVVSADGRVRVEDDSTNGTTIVSDSDLIRSEEGGGFPKEYREQLNRFVSPLIDKPHLWQRQFAGQRVIDPY